MKQNRDRKFYLQNWSQEDRDPSQDKDNDPGHSLLPSKAQRQADEMRQWVGQFLGFALCSYDKTNGWDTEIKWVCMPCLPSLGKTNTMPCLSEALTSGHSLLIQTQNSQPKQAGGPIGLSFCIFSPYSSVSHKH